MFRPLTAAERQKNSRLNRSEEKIKSDNAASAARMKLAYSKLTTIERKAKADKSKNSMAKLRAKRKEEAINVMALKLVHVPESEPELVNMPGLATDSSVATERDPYEGELEYYEDDLSDVEIDETEQLGQTFAVETILDRRFNMERRSDEFLIKWENCDDSANTWEVEENLVTLLRDGQRLESTNDFINRKQCLKNSFH